MAIYKPSLLDKFKDFVNGLRSNWDQYEAHVADFEAHLAESANKHIHSSGSDDNGYWTKYDDGTLTQTFTITVTQNFTAWLGWYRAVHNVEIPKPFIDNRYTVSVRVISSAGQIVQALGGSNTSITLYCYRPSETSESTTTFIISASGRWK